MSALNLLLLDDVQCWPHYVEPWHSLMAPYSPSLLFNQPASPTETCTSFASSSSGSLERQPTHVVCNAPLVAPIPLPFHSPTFLQFELLPDIDEDLSHPPYTTRSRTAALKRKRTEDDTVRQLQKRRLNAPLQRRTRNSTRVNMPRR